MNYIILHIPTRTIVQEPTNLCDGIFCFHSKFFDESLGLYSQKMGLIIDLDKHINYQRIISDFITTLNVIRQEYLAIQWLSRLDYTTHIVNSELSILEHIELLKYCGERKLMLDDLRGLQLHLVCDNYTELSFIDIFNELVEQETNSFIYNALKYLAVSNSIIMTSNRVYDNALFENALLFQIFEAIMVNYEKKYIEENKQCEYCERSIKIGLNKRIHRFLHDIQITDPLIIKSIRVIANSRHKFFHSLAGLTGIEHSNLAFSKVPDNYLSFENELKHADATFLGKGVLRRIITLYLVDRLQRRND